MSALLHANVPCFHNSKNSDFSKNTLSFKVKLLNKAYEHFTAPCIFYKLFFQGVISICPPATPVNILFTVSSPELINHLCRHSLIFHVSSVILGLNSTLRIPVRWHAGDLKQFLT